MGAAVFFFGSSAAMANHVNDAASSASCALVGGVPTVTLQVRFEAFGPENEPVTGTVELDGTMVKSYDGITFSGSDYTLVYSQPTTAGDHTIRGEFTWPGLAAGDKHLDEHNQDDDVPDSAGRAGGTDIHAARTGRRTGPYRAPVRRRQRARVLPLARRRTTTTRRSVSACRWASPACVAPVAACGGHSGRG